MFGFCGRPNLLPVTDSLPCASMTNYWRVRTSPSARGALHRIRLHIKAPLIFELSALVLQCPFTMDMGQPIGNSSRPGALHLFLSCAYKPRIASLGKGAPLYHLVGMCTLLLSLTDWEINVILIDMVFIWSAILPRPRRQANSGFIK